MRVPEELTRPVEKVDMPPLEFFRSLSCEDQVYSLSAIAIAREIRIEQANGRLRDISKIGADSNPGATE